MRCLHRVPSEAMMSLKSGVLGTHGHARGLRATGHVAAPDPSRTRSRVWSHKTCDDTGALLGGGPDTSVTWRRQSLTAQGAGLKPRGTWRLRSPLLPGDGLGASGHVATPKPFLTGGALGASGHVATPEPFPGGWCVLCYEARGNTGALFWQMACSMPRGTWRSQRSLAPETDLEPCDWSFKSCAEGRVPTTSTACMPSKV
jgi:hypothetical protein